MRLAAAGAWVALFAVVAASAIAVVHARHEYRRLFIELTALTTERDELNVEFGRLQLEQATWADTNRVEQLARAQLGLTFPDATQLRVLER
jgi:cell division protein FtsL